MPSASHAAPELGRPTESSKSHLADFNVATDGRYFSALARFDINFASLMWIYDNVRLNSSVLDIGCADEMLGILKRKNAQLTGLTATTQRARAARANGYDAACASHPSQLPFPEASFDHVVSFELFNRFTSEELKIILLEIKRVLRRGGTALLGISHPAALARGNENDFQASPSGSSEFEKVNLQEQQLALLHSHFAYVTMRARDALCLSSAEFLREADKLRFPVEKDFLDYLRGLSFRERRAFDMAMGHVYDKLSRLEIETPENDFEIFIQASDQPFDSLGDESRGRAWLLKPVPAFERSSVRLDEAAAFDEGWHEQRDLPPRAHLMSERGRVRFAARPA
ncbi:MAG: class I SAM-dependent methyltransferase, partial [Pyrinomonadaceae bacterium]|nr:class I SAM-dependent methyltransferase [Pyrinomonadaceae bacterium]